MRSILTRYQVEFRFDKLENYSPINCNLVILFSRYAREIVTIFKIEEFINLLYLEFRSDLKSI